MPFTPSQLAIVFLGTGAASLLLLYEPIRRPDKPGSRGFALTVVGVSLMPISRGLTTLLPGLDASLAAFTVVLLAVSIGSVGTFLLMVEFTNRGSIPRWILAPALGFLFVEVAVLWTNPTHHFVLGPGTGLEQGWLMPDFAAGFWIHTAINYVLIGTATALMFRETMRSRGVRRKQAAALSVAPVPPIVANLVTLYVAPAPYDLTPFGLVGTGLIFAWALYRADFLDVVPIARKTAIAEMDDAVVTLDADDRVVDCNESAREAFGVDGRYAGISATEFFDSPAVDRFDGTADDELQITATSDERERHFSLSVSPIGADLGGDAGRVAVLRDITALKSRERALEAREGELDLLRQVLSRILRHNIRNELTAINWNAERIAENADERHAERAREILSGSDDLLAISEKARCVERIIDGDDAPVPIDLRPLAEDVARDVGNRYPNVAIGVDGSEECRVRTNPMIGAAVENLVENAARYNDAADPRVSVTLEVRACEHRLTVTDNGPGIPEHEVSVLKAKKETPLAHGSGIGLWIVKWIVDRSGSELSFEANEGGTAVTIRFHERAGNARTA